jgi:uracil-DNA glycosylase
MGLNDALSEMLEGWIEDLNPAWREVFEGVELGIDDVDADLQLLSHEPIFPSRRQFGHLGAPEGAHMLRAFDDIEPESVRAIMLGQDPYPCMAFSTGRAFDIGSYGSWRDLERMFTHSMRSLTQCVCAERAGRPELARSTGEWSDTITAIESSEFELEAPPLLAQTWVDQGVLLLNSSLTISRFAVSGDPHQTRGHLLLWRPFMVRLLRRLLLERRDPPVIILFGDAAKATFNAAIQDLTRSDRIEISVVETEHPAAGDNFLENGNPLSQCNALLAARGEQPVVW